MDVKSTDDVGFVGDGGRCDIWIVNGRKVNYGLAAGHGLHDLAEILNVADQILDRTAVGTRQAIENGDFMCWRIEQFPNHPLTNFPKPPVTRIFIGRLRRNYPFDSRLGIPAELSAQTL
jgi:hypothetical protein